MPRRLFPFLLAALLLAGCGGGSGPSGGGGGAAGPPMLLETQAAPVQALAGGTVQTDLGHQVVFPPGSLSQDALVTVTVLSHALEAPSGDEFAPFGHSLRVDLGEARLVGPAHFHLLSHGARPGTTWMTWRVGGLSIPLETTVADRTVSGTLDGQPFPLPAEDSGEIVLGLVDSSTFDSRPPHVPWDSYNLYVYQQLITPNGEQDQFTRVVYQGQVVGQMPALGAKPLLMVHGLGSSIRKQGFVGAAKYLQANGGYTAVLGFEYDTQKGVASNGQLLHQAYEQLNALSPGLTWHHLGHSMGSLVSRSNFEQTGPLGIAPTGNRVLTVCGPHLGSAIIDVIQGDKNLAQRIFVYLVMNDVMQFTNADGTKCQVTGLEQGFTDLRPDSAFLAQINAGAAGNHPQADYTTAGGDHRGLEFDALDFVAYGLHTSEYLDDGLVDLFSANPNPANPPPHSLDIGALQQAVLDDNHTAAMTDPAAFPTLQSLLSP